MQAMLFLMKQEGRHVIAARTVHRAFLNACMLLGLEVTWVYPSTSHGILSGAYLPEDFVAALEACKAQGKPACVYLTSPDYLGHIGDVAGIAAVSHRYDAPLLVDNAHGAHLAFLAENRHPMALGADLCCDSAHKMLPCLTGCAYLHTAQPAYAQRLKAAMGVFGSTSPSYLMLLSLDCCNRFLAEECRGHLAQVVAFAKSLRQELAGKVIWAVEDGDPLHLSLDTAAMGCDGRRLAAQLEQMGCYAEYAGREALVLLLSAGEEMAQLERLRACLRACDVTPDAGAAETPPPFPQPEVVYGIREAGLGASESIPVTEALGRICASVQVPCPPAVPIVISGERVDQTVIDTLNYYQIRTISVLRRYRTKSSDVLCAVSP
jgi:arginine/lysine/ornithine decarboxylase